jgi:hypothetical protein
MFKIWILSHRKTVSFCQSVWERWSSVVVTATLNGLDGSGCELQQGWGLRNPSRPAMGLTHPPAQWVPVVLPGGKAAGESHWPYSYQAPRLSVGRPTPPLHPGAILCHVTGWPLPFSFTWTFEVIFNNDLIISWKSQGNKLSRIL